MVRRFNHDPGVSCRVAGLASRRNVTVVHGPGREAGLVGMARIASHAIDSARDRNMAGRQRGAQISLVIQIIVATGRALAAAEYRIRTQICVAHRHQEPAGSKHAIGVAGVARSACRDVR